MPELPEVEVVRLFLQSHLVGKTIADIQVLNSKSFIGDPQKIIGTQVTSFSRRGKQLSVHLSNKLILLVHLKMTGQLVYLSKTKTTLGHPTPNLNNSQLPNKSTRVIFKFNNHCHLFFNDQRKFGWIKILTQKQLTQFQQNLGLDIFDPKFTPDYLCRQLHSTTRPAKLVLLDQSKFAGIGNIYANDALFLSKIHPQTKSNTISRFKSQKLHHALLQIMTESVAHGGSTAKDNKYLLPDGSKGTHQFHFQVYQRDGQSCRLCHTLIKRIALGGRGTFFCPKCQKEKPRT